MYSITDTSNANFYYRGLIFYYGQLQKIFYIRALCNFGKFYSIVLYLTQRYFKLPEHLAMKRDTKRRM